MNEIVLNLDGSKIVKTSRDAHVLEYEKFIFSGGEPHIKLYKSSLDKIIRSDEFNSNNTTNILINTTITNSDDLMYLVLSVDALRRLLLSYDINNYNISVSMPYFPGARQDRIMVNGEPLSSKVYADIINSMNLDKVVIFDPHSDVVPALLNNCKVINNHNLVDKILNYELYNIGNYYLVSPDAGSEKKIGSLHTHLVKMGNRKIIDVVKCSKIRDVRTGKLSGFNVNYDDLNNKPCIIIDDICDGGGTFLGLYDELKNKNAGDIYLIVSHGIFSKGTEVFDKFKQVFTINSFNHDSNELSTNIKLINVK